MASPCVHMKFQPGDYVRVRVCLGDDKRHIRTPRYIQGLAGIVERIHGLYRNPESLAYGGSGSPAVPLYMVTFEQRVVWGQYPVGSSDRLCVDIFEHWLEPVGTEG